MGAHTPTWGYRDAAINPMAWRASKGWGTGIEEVNRLSPICSKESGSRPTGRSQNKVLPIPRMSGVLPHCSSSHFWGKAARTMSPAPYPSFRGALGPVWDKR